MTSLKHIDIYFILLLILVSNNLLGNEVKFQKLFDEANLAYQENKFDEAKEKYHRILDLNIESEAVYFNLGNVYYQLGEIAPCILYYEKALKINPSNEDFIFNLKIAQLKTIDKIEPLPVPFYQTFFANTIYQSSADNWAKFSLSLFFVALIFAAVFLFIKKNKIKKISFLLGFLALIVGFVFLSFAYIQKNHQENFKEAIVFQDNIYAKTAPNDNGSDAFILHEGTKVQILDKFENWKKIKLADGKIAWVLETDLKEI